MGPSSQRASRRQLGAAALFLVAATALVVWLSIAEEPSGDRAEGVSVRVVGDPETIFDWSSQACEPNHIPDLPVRAFRDHREQVQLVLPHFTNRRMSGPNLDRLRVDCGPILRSTGDPEPASFNDREWIASLHTRDGSNVVALLHEEYQGHLHPGRCPQRSYEPCWYNAITFARSTDGGRSFWQPAPSRRLVASSSYRYDAGAGPYGAFAPSNIVRNPDDGYYYVIVKSREPRAEQRGSCLLRTRRPEDPPSWRAWDGEGFGIEPVDPYGSRSATPQLCEPVATAEISEMSESLTYNTYLERFLLVGLAGAPGAGGELVSGAYFSLSDDLIQWTPRKPIMAVESRHSFVCGDEDPIAYPSLLDPASRSRTFATTGKRPYLYYTQFNYEGCRQTLDRDLVRVPLELGG